MYGKSPTLGRGDDGHMEVKANHGSKQPSKADQEVGGTEGVISHEHRHRSERRELHQRHLREHMEIHHKHETEHELHEHGGHGEKVEMHARHHQEMVSMHEQHENEHKEMLARHDHEGGTESRGEHEKGGEKLIEKTENDKKED